MNQTPPDPEDDVRLSDDQIHAMSQGLRRQYLSQERGVASSVGSAVVGGIEGTVKRLLVLFRLPLVLVFGLAGFIVMNGRVSFFVAVAIAVAAMVLGATLIGGILRFIDMRAYRRVVR